MAVLALQSHDCLNGFEDKLQKRSTTPNIPWSEKIPGFTFSLSKSSSVTKTGPFSESYALLQPPPSSSTQRLIVGSPLSCRSREVKSDLSGAFWLYNPGIESVSDVIYLFFFFLINSVCCWHRLRCPLALLGMLHSRASAYPQLLHQGKLHPHEMGSGRVPKLGLYCVCRKDSAMLFLLLNI